MTAKVTPLTRARKGRARLDRSAVVREARQMVIENGHEALSLRPLAARLGVTAAALYAYVDDKHDLLRSIALAEFDNLADLYEAIESDQPTELLRQISQIYVRFAEHNPELFRVTFLFPPARDADQEEEHRAYRIARDAVAQGMQAGDIRPGDIELTSQSIWAAVHGVAVFSMEREDLNGDFRYAMVDLVVSSILAGLATERESA